MEPTGKDTELEKMLTRISGSDRRETIRANVCRPTPMGCGGRAETFSDKLSVNEFAISGLCQQCQDKVFGFGPANRVSG